MKNETQMCWFSNNRSKIGTYYCMPISNAKIKRVYYFDDIICSAIYIYLSTVGNINTKLYIFCLFH